MTDIIPSLHHTAFLEGLRIPRIPKDKKRRTLHPINPPIFSEAGDGKPIVLVPLTNTGHLAIVDREDWERLMDQGVSPNWFMVFRESADTPLHARRWTVRVAMPSRSPVQQVSLSRLIAGAVKGEIIHMADGNPLNLRRSNLVRGRKPKATKSPKE